jgi:hypothetical protein
MTFIYVSTMYPEWSILPRGFDLSYELTNHEKLYA